MTDRASYALVCVGGGPRAAAALRARFPDAEFCYAGPAAYAPCGSPVAASVREALSRLRAPRAIVLDPAVQLDATAAEALGAAADEGVLAAPLLVDGRERIAGAACVLVADPPRGRAVVRVAAGGSRTDLGAHDAGALDGRCIAGATALLAHIAPAADGADAWLAATAAAASEGLALRVLAVRVPVEEPLAAPVHDDPRRCAAETLHGAHASPPWSGFAADVAHGVVARSLRTPFGADLVVVESAPSAAAIVVGEPADRVAFERMLRANALPLDAIDYACGPGALDIADAALSNRGDRFVALVDARTVTPPGWLDASAAALDADGLAAFAVAHDGAPDARATVIATARIPSAERLHAFETLHGAIADLALRAARDLGRGTRRIAQPRPGLPPPVDDVAFRLRYGHAPHALRADETVRAPRFRGIATIVMLSWNAPEFTRTAVESISAVTRYPHEILIVDNGSEAPTRDVLAALAGEHGVRVVYNERNLGFGGGMNVGMAHARGDVVVILNNDVVVTDGWLETMIGALEMRRTVGCTAPRSNRVASEQQIPAPYTDLASMHRFASARAAAYRGRGYLAQRLVGFCLCLDRRVIDDVGGFDPLYGIGNYEDDDLSVRMRGAGWEMFVCDDAFIHHFGSASFIANKVDYMGHMETNWRAFCDKWNLPHAPLYTPYDARGVGRRGFERERHFVPLPVAP